MASVAFDFPRISFKDWIDREITGEMKRQVTAGVRGATEGMKIEMRQAVNNAGLGTRLGNAIRSEGYPQDRRGKTSFHAAGLVFVRRPKGERSGALEIFDAFGRGVTITARGGKYLAIPTRAVPRTRGRQMTPAEVEQFYGRKLVVRPGGRPDQVLLFLPLIRAKSRRRPGYRSATPRRVKAGREVEDVLLFVLVKQVRLDKRLDFDSIADKWAGQIPRLIQLVGGG